MVLSESRRELLGGGPSEGVHAGYFTPVTL